MEGADVGDADETALVNVTDAVFILNYLFLGGPAPPAPGPTSCGPDGEKEAPDLGCDVGCAA